MVCSAVFSCSGVPVYLFMFAAASEVSCDASVVVVVVLFCCCFCCRLLLCYFLVCVGPCLRAQNVVAHVLAALAMFILMSETN